MEKTTEIARATLSTVEIMRVTGLGRDAVRALVRTGTLKSICKRRILVPRSELVKLLGDLP